MTEKIDAYWFAAGNRLPHGDNRPIVIGKKHSLRGDIVLCKHALHASRDPFDALYYAPGPYLYKVRCWGAVVEDRNKLGARHREYLAMRDATNMLCLFAREQALSVIHLWDAPVVVKRYLETGDEAIRDAARDASQAAVWDADYAAKAGTYAVRDAARAAARAAAGDAVRAAVWAAAGAAARAAARATTWAAVRKRFNDLVAALFATA